MAFLSDIGKVKLKAVPTEERRDRSGANVKLAGADVLADEAERWKYFFEAGCNGWFEKIKDHTFRSTFLDLHREEAETILEHWDKRKRAKATAARDETLIDSQLKTLFGDAVAKLEPLRERLHAAVALECAASSAGLAFVKLSTRSPKDSRKALTNAKAAYQVRLDAAQEDLDDNERWKILLEEVTRAGAVATGADALELLLDSERVFEDLEYALRGPKDDTDISDGSICRTEPPPSAYNVSIVARAWDPRLTLQSEFRGIVWGGQLTCLGQYFHPLFFPDLLDKKGAIEADCRELFARPAVSSAVHALRGHCLIDFAWLGPGEVIIVELNPFDGVCLGTFPASTGLFLWDNEHDHAIMKGETPFEMRVRDRPLPAAELKAQCNPDWRRIIYKESDIWR